MFRAPGKIFALKSLCTDGVDFVSGKAENFFKLWIVLKFVCITGGSLWIGQWITIGKI